MSRVIALVVFGALVAALFLSDPPSATRLAAAEVGKALEATPEGGFGAFPRRADSDPTARPLPANLAAAVGDPDGLAGTLLAALLESPAVRALPPEVAGGRERIELQLGGSNIRSDEEIQWDPIWPARVRESVLRQVRATCEANGVELVVEGLKSPAPSGVNLLAVLSLAERRLDLQLELAGGAKLLASRPWRAIDQLSLLPPLIAIFLAILLRRPVAALFAGLWAGASLVGLLDGAGTLAALGGGLRDTFTSYIWHEITEQARLQIILFVVFMLSMVGVITRAGGIQGVMERLATIARDAKRSQIATWFMGLAVFFDDYANTILVGTTMRPLTDKFKVAREKLAYIVDSTAAPVAGISVLSTWIAFEVSTFSPSLPDAELGANQGYAIFLQTMPYRYYCLLTLAFVGMIVFSGRDFGPMLTAERRARGGKLLRDGAQPMVGEAATRLEAEPGVRVSAVTALVPLLVFIGTVFGLILYKGGALAMGARFFSFEGVTQVLLGGSGNETLMWGGIAGFLCSLVFAGLAGLQFRHSLSSAFDALRSMGIAFAILYLAWSLGAVCQDLGTATFLAVSLGDTLPWMILPGVLFLLSGMIAFSTGSSWGTMTILLPLVVGLAYQLGYDSIDAALGMGPQREAGLLLLTISIGAVLEGAIFGDHCSPISDTTVMSSIASASDHIDHVRTQMPYAMLTMVVALVCGYFPATFLKWNPFVCLVLGVAVLALFLRVYGKQVDQPVIATEGPVSA